MRFKVFAFLVVVFVWNSVYSAAQSSFRQLEIFDAPVPILGQAAEVFSGSDQSNKRQRTAPLLESSGESIVELSDRMNEMHKAITLLSKSLAESDADKQQRDARMIEMGIEIAQLRHLTTRNVDIIKQLSMGTILSMASAPTFDVVTIQEIAIWHVQKMLQLPVSPDDEVIQHICLIMAERFLAELNKVPVPSSEDRGSFIMCANSWLNKLEYPKLSPKFHSAYLRLVKKLRPKASWSLISDSYGLI